MLIWIAIALMTAVAVMAVLYPLRRGATAVADRTAHEASVYRDQLQAVERDLERGLIDEREAEAARTEIGRRLIKAGAGDAETPDKRSVAGVTAIAAVILVPLVALGGYALIGSPGMPDQPLEVRLANGNQTHDIGAMVAQVEARLAQDPNNLEGWQVIAPIYMRLGRYGDGAEAYRRQLALGQTDPDTEENFGEALVAANNGLVNADAQKAFEAALAAEPDRMKSRYYVAEALAQSGKAKEALAAYDGIIASSPADAPWLAIVRDHRKAQLTALKLALDTPEPETLPPENPNMAAQPGPSAADVQAADQMTPEERQAMITGMVEKLADRLKTDPKDAEGWQRLIRAYGVLGRTSDAKAAYESAKTAFAGDTAALAAIDAVAQEAGIAQ